ncbi:MAG TPA: YajQ family cyclic di-GMP-binding protein [Candidatus Bathyarchaeia archaeon]|nr:YajQ family cyclic di-GMP-binding protein [Candidatus Bathyarchaeia archaeon]
MPSFDVVSKVDMQEVTNALQQTRKEIAQRYDFKGTQTEIEQEKDTIKITSDSDFKVKAVVDILQSKLVKRGVNLKSLEYGKIEPAAGGLARQSIQIHQGLDTDAAREVVKIIKDTKLKVQAQVQDDQVRVTGKQRDELQQVIQRLRAADFRRPLQYVNMRD